MDINPLDTEQIGLKTLEKHLIRSRSEVSLKIGIPREHSNDERRVCLTPGGVAILKANGHDIYIEKGAGDEASFQTVTMPIQVLKSHLVPKMSSKSRN